MKQPKSVRATPSNSEQPSGPCRFRIPRVRKLLEFSLGGEVLDVNGPSKELGLSSLSVRFRDDCYSLLFCEFQNMDHRLTVDSLLLLSCHRWWPKRGLCAGVCTKVCVLPIHSGSGARRRPGKVVPFVGRVRSWRPKDVPLPPSSEGSGKTLSGVSEPCGGRCTR